MLKASSLFLTVVLSIIIAIVSSSLILFSYLNKLQFETSLQLKKIQLNADSGINLLLSKQDIVAFDKVVSIDLYNKQNDYVELQRKSWGALEIITSSARFKNHVEHRVAQVGSGMKENDNTAIYMADLDRPLSVCGATMIKGTAYLPQAGIKRAYIEGQNFLGNKLVEGEIKQSSKVLPSMDKALLERISSVFERNFNDKDSIIDIENIEAGASIKNSFYNNSLFLVNNSSIFLNDENYSGNIVILSDKTIKISANTVLNDVLLFAKRIEIEEGFTGTLQAFATDSIIVEKKCSLNYPSVLGIIRAPSSPDLVAMIIKEESSFSGSLFAYQENVDYRKQVVIMLQKKTTITGHVYSNGYVDVKGSITGNLTCNKIILQTPSSIYENHLLNVVIDRTALSKYYAGINIEGLAENKKVIKWLY